MPGRTLVAALLCTVPLAAQAQRLYVGPAIQIGSSRVIGLSGAFVGIGEGGDGFAQNFAAAAQRHPALSRGWDWDALFSLMLPVSVFERDLDNDGVADHSTQSLELLAGGMLQVGRFGAGAYLRQSTVLYCGNGSCQRADAPTLTRDLAGVGGGLSVWRDQLIVGAGLLHAGARVSYGGNRFAYGGWSVATDLLYRPAGRPFRIGLSYRPETHGDLLPDSSQVVDPSVTPRFRAVVSPAILSVGASFRPGDGGERYNRLSPAAHAQLSRSPDNVLPPLDPTPGRPGGRLLLSGQLDLAQPASDAVALDLSNGPALTAIGEDLYFTPRFGAEWEVLEHRLRLRAGSYIEPSPFVGGSPRPHLTGGCELFLLRFLDDWSVSAAWDVAPRYYNVTVGIGFWN